jgi:HD-GYP domain-containing protein (c-di-GMP phosphodiesterase class II)
MWRPWGLSRINAFVTAVVVAATACLAFAWTLREAFPGAWAFGVFFALGVLLDLSATTLKGRPADGSVSFITHLPLIPLFGGFWCGLITGLATLVSQVLSRRPRNRVAFNTAQKIVSIVVAAGVYTLLGGEVRPALIVPGAPTSFQAALHTIGAFLVGSGTYFLSNSLLVCGAIAISTGKQYQEIWRSTAIKLLNYDVAASILALLVAWLFLLLDDPTGLRRFFFLAAFAPVLLIRHAYTKLRTLQELYDALDAAHARLEQNVREQLAMMVKSIEARDPYTSGHSRRVSALSKAIAIDFGLSEDLVEEVENAALLHDVGKIHAEFAPLLSKEGKLTPEEWEIMKTHSVKSSELVGLFGRFKGHVQDSVRHHHERWDGLGYPDGIAGETIPLGARIIMIADTIDAMTTDRPYRKALGFESVVGELQKHRTTQFDARLVDCVMSSVTIRRMIAQPNLGVDNGPVLESSGPLRSYGSFFLGRRNS